MMYCWEFTPHCGWSTPLWCWLALLRFGNKTQGKEMYGETLAAHAALVRSSTAFFIASTTLWWIRGGSAKEEDQLKPPRQRLKVGREETTLETS